MNISNDLHFMVDPLTTEEIKWLKNVEKLLNQCPSKRIEFVVGGDCSISVVDNTHPDHSEWFDFDFNGGQLADLSFFNGPQIVGMCI